MILSQQEVDISLYKSKLITNNPNYPICVQYDIKLIFIVICSFICKVYEESLITQLNTLKNTELEECNSHNKLNHIGRIDVDRWTGWNKLFYIVHILVENTSQAILNKGFNVLTVLL